eukprot:Anaeramoba_ignava/a347219_194.p3 GENE.a347219_194~~a347219_194.p3  ORF type:complete len:197 (+),score=51.56 a347219_194:24-593(+)
MTDDWDEDSNVERTLLTIRESHVFKIPPLQTSQGYRCSEWEGNHMWTGRLKVVAKGEDCTIRLEDSESGKIFAQCPVDTSNNQSVIPAVDSSRFFVLRIEDGKGHHAFIGMGFQERTDAFDFNLALQDHKKEIERKKNPPKFDGPTEDLSLKQGETIRINLSGMPTTTSTKKAKSTSKKITLKPPPKFK